MLENSSHNQKYSIEHSGYLSLLLSRLPQLPDLFEKHRLDNFGNLSKSIEIYPQATIMEPYGMTVLLLQQ